MAAALTPPHLRRTHSLGFKVTADEAVRFGFFAETFYGTNSSAALHWLVFENPEVAKIIDERIAAGMVQS